MAHPTRTAPRQIGGLTLEWPQDGAPASVPTASTRAAVPKFGLGRSGPSLKWRVYPNTLVSGLRAAPKKGRVRHRPFLCPNHSLSREERQGHSPRIYFRSGCARATPPASQEVYESRRADLQGDIGKSGKSSSLALPTSFLPQPPLSRLG